MKITIKNFFKKILNSLHLLKFIRSYNRRKLTLNYYKPKINLINKWCLKDTEDSNFYYDLTDHNLDILAQIISIITKKNYQEIRKYFEELSEDYDLKEHIKKELLINNYGKEFTVDYSRRIGWYAIARAIRPKIIIESGVSHGVGSCVLTKALILNRQEGYPGKYFGTEIDPKMGKLLVGKYKNEGQIIYGDSINTLGKFDDKIDLFINDSDHSADYEYREYNSIKNKVNDNSIILGDNSHSTDKLSTFSKEQKRRFIFFKEQPLNHWYPGAGIGISY